MAVKLMREKEDETELYYWRDYHDPEVDFVVKEGDSISQLIRVSAVNDIHDLRPRENRSKLVLGGADQEVSDQVTSTFERCVYHPDPPTEDSIKEYDASIVEVTSWYGSLSSDNEDRGEESSG